MTHCTLSPQVRASHSTLFSTRPKEQRGAQPFWNRKKKKSPPPQPVVSLTLRFFFSVWLTGRPSSLRDSNYSEIKSHYYGSSLSKPLRRKGGPLVKLHIRKYSGSGQGQGPLFLDPESHTVRPVLHTQRRQCLNKPGMLPCKSVRGRPNSLTSVSALL